MEQVIDDIPVFDLSDIAYNPVKFTIKTPPGFQTMRIPKDNPTTVDGILLGRHLFYDPILSRDSSISCATCHKQELAFTDGLAKSVGIDGRVGPRSAMSLANVGFVNRGLFWDGRSITLEDQALHPVENPVEMDAKWPEVIRKFQVHSGYPEMFRKAFGISNNKEITKELVAKALAQFQRTLVSPDSEYQRFLRGDILELSEAAYQGLRLYEKETGDVSCLHCHNPPTFATDNFFHNGLFTADEDDTGMSRYSVTDSVKDKGHFRAVTLQNIGLTGPYMHDGRLPDLKSVVEHYFKGGNGSPRTDPFVTIHAQYSFTETQKMQLVKFLETLTDTAFITNPLFSNPFE